MTWNGTDMSNGNRKIVVKTVGKAAGKTGRLHKCLFVGIMLLIGLIIILVALPDKDSVSSTAEELKMPEKRQNVVSVQVEKQVASMPEHPAPQKEIELPARPILGTTPTGEEYVHVSATTNTSGVVEELFTLVDGSKKRIVTLQSKDTLIFENDFDLMLGLIGTTPLDQKLPPMPDLGNMEDQFKKAIATPITIRESDTEKAKAMKQAALDLRQEISDLMNEGYTLTQILSEYESLRLRNVEERHLFQSKLNEIYKSGDIEGARAYLELANRKLEEFGIIPLVMPGEGSKRRIKQ